MKFAQFDPHEDNRHYHDTTKALRAPSPVIQPRPVTVNGKRYVSVSAHALLDVLSETEHHGTRPGHPLG
jgi:hypothetical protein